MSYEVVGRWHFTYGDVGWTNGFAWVEGYFRSRFNSRANEIRLLSERLTLCPAANWSRYNLVASRAWCATNGVDGLIVTFEGAAVGDNPTKIANVQMELFPRTGEVALRYDLANVGDSTYTAGLVIGGTNRFVEVGAGTCEVLFQRVHPDDWDMDGIPNSIDDTPQEPSLNTGYNQTDAWAMAAFPSNSAEIATIGYAAWAAERAADPNRRLIGLRIVSPNNAWPVCLTFGGKQVMCDGNAEIMFAIDCGARYPFSISGDGVLEFFILHGEVDDVQPCAAYGYPYERWANDVVAHMESPSSGWIGRTAEVLMDDVDIGHLYPNGSQQVTAVVTNCHEDAYLGCRWVYGDGISVSDEHSLVTTVSYCPVELTEWATNYLMLVTEYVGGYEVTNNCIFTVGTQSEPSPDFDLACQNVQFLNNDMRSERVYPVTVAVRGPHGFRGKARISVNGQTNAMLFWDRQMTREYEDEDIVLAVPSSGDTWSVVRTLYMISPFVGNGEISATFVPDESEGDSSTDGDSGDAIGGDVADGGDNAGGGDADGDTNGGDGSDDETEVVASYEDAMTFRVIEPLRKLVTSEKGNDGQYVNPSRLVYGKTAVLKVEAKGPFSPSEVNWVCDESKGRIIARDGWSVTVEPLVDSGDFVVEAWFNEDAIQPKFVLPIVRERVIDVKVFVTEVEGEAVVSRADIVEKIDYANEVFRQAGIRFNLAAVETLPDSERFSRLTGVYEEESYMLFWKRQVLTRQVSDLLGYYQQMPSYSGNDCIEVYVVDKIAGGINGFTNSRGIIVKGEAHKQTLAHELGHALGLADCYVDKAIDSRDPNSREVHLENANRPVSNGCFESHPFDWGTESKRVFYEATDRVRNVYIGLLMFGSEDANGRNGCDIPDGCVDCLQGNGLFYTGKGFTPVGARNFKENNGEVYTR